MRRLAGLVLGAVAAACGASGPADFDLDGQDRIVQRDVDAMAGAFYAGNLDVVLQYTHPGIIESWGGAVKAREAMGAALAPFLKEGGRVEDFHFPAKPEFVRTERAVYAIVPTQTVVAIGEQRTQSLKYHFGVLEPGAAGWKYIDGSNINAANVQSFFPDFPANHRFPRFQRKQL